MPFLSLSHWFPQLLGSVSKRNHKDILPFKGHGVGAELMIMLLPAAAT